MHQFAPLICNLTILMRLGDSIVTKSVSNVASDFRLNPLFRYTSNIKNTHIHVHEHTHIYKPLETQIRNLKNRETHTALLSVAIMDL